MALIADNGADRAEQLLVLSERLRTLVEEETARIQARAPTAPPELVAEKERLANAYRLELTRIKEDPGLLDGAPKALLDALKAATANLQSALDAHEIALGAVRIIAEGLVQAMGEEIHRQRAQTQVYGADGARKESSGPQPVAFDRTA